MKAPLRCLVVDDEPLAVDVLRTYVERVGELHLVGTCSSALEALPYLQQQAVDLLFLDIEMPFLTGLELLQTLRHPPAVVLTTAYRDYALEGFEWDVADYLLKPISFQRFLKAVHKLLPAQPTALPAPPVAAPTPAGLVTEAPSTAIFFRADKRIVKVKLDDILYIESLKDYIRIKTKTQDVVTYQTMNAVAEKLPPEQFVRVHKSYIIALNKVRAIEGNMVEIGDQQIVLSRHLRAEVLEKIYRTGIWGVK